MIKNIPANKFLSFTRGDFDEWEFSGLEFSRGGGGGDFTTTNKFINYFLKTLLSFYMMFFSQFPHYFQ